MAGSQESACCSARKQMGGSQGGCRKGYAPLRHPARSDQGRPGNRPQSRGRGIHPRTGWPHSRARLLRERPLPAARIAPFAKGRRLRSKRFRNCPFDEDYDHILQAVLFCLVRFGLKPRIAMERSDAGESRINKILGLIQSSRYSIHDLCRCQARDEGEYYRLNMPFELGLDFGCRRYGGGRLATKVIIESPDREILRLEHMVLNGLEPRLPRVDLRTVEVAAGRYVLLIRVPRSWIGPHRVEKNSKFYRKPGLV